MFFSLWLLNHHNALDIPGRHFSLSLNSVFHLKSAFPFQLYLQVRGKRDGEVNTFLQLVCDNSKD